MSAITSDIQGFLLDMGAEAGTFEYESSCKGTKAYSAEIRFLGEDAEDMAEEIAENVYELQEHLRTTYPEVKVTLSITAAEEEYLVEEDRSEEELLDDICVGIDDEDADTTDDADRQYEEEGLRIFHEDDEDADFIDEEDEEEDEDFEEEFKSRKRSKVDDDEGFYEDEDEEDEYIPSDEDREELWRMFGGDEDE